MFSNAHILVQGFRQKYQNCSYFTRGVSYVDDTNFGGGLFFHVRLRAEKSSGLSMPHNNGPDNHS